MLFLLKSSSYAHIRAPISTLAYLIRNIIRILFVVNVHPVFQNSDQKCIINLLFGHAI